MPLSDRLARKIKKIIYDLAGFILLFPKRKEHRLAFSLLGLDFSKRADSFSKYDFSAYVTPHWHKMNTQMEAAALPDLPFDFLRHPTIGYTMFVSRGGQLMRSELDYIERSIPDAARIKAILREEPIGDPMIMNIKYATSHNSIHHLFHILKWSEQARVLPETIDTVFEWGGGYGNLARIWRRLAGASGTYIMTDTPLFCAIQWLYLSVVFGKENVNAIDRPGQSIEAGKINIIPIGLLKEYAEEIRAGIFISTWALSESSRYSQQFALDNNLFGAKHILVAYQDANPDLPDSEGVRVMAERYQARLEGVEYISNSHYIFK